MSQDLDIALKRLAETLKRAEDDTDPGNPRDFELSSLHDAIVGVRAEVGLALKTVPDGIADRFRPVFDELRADLWERRYGVRFGKPPERENTSKVEISKSGAFLVNITGEDRKKLLSVLRLLLAGSLGALLNETAPRIYKWLSVL